MGQLPLNHFNMSLSSLNGSQIVTSDFSAERRILTQERVKNAFPHVIRTIFFVPCIPIVIQVGVVLRAER